MRKILTSWSGGKDSCFAMMQAVGEGLQPTVLLNMMNENGKVSRSHAIPEHILQQQATALGLSMVNVAASWNDYESLYIKTLNELVPRYGIDTAVFGDIDLQAHKEWEEKVCAAAGIEAYLPLWQKDRKELVQQMLSGGIKTYIVSCNEIMGPSFLGRILDNELVNELTALGIDECGENGEFHTLVVNCPLFEKEVAVQFGEKLHHGNYWFIEMR